MKSGNHHDRRSNFNNRNQAIPGKCIFLANKITIKLKNKVATTCDKYYFLTAAPCCSIHSSENINKSNMMMFERLGNTNGCMHFFMNFNEVNFFQ